MQSKALPSLFFHLLIISSLFSQSNPSNMILSGVIKDVSPNPIPNLRVMILNAGKDTTDSDGKFHIDLSRCKACLKNGKVKIRMFNEAYGYHERELNLGHIDNGYNVTDIIIPKNPNSVSFIGIVKDKISDEPIPNLDIKITGDTILDQTDEFGEFSFRFNRRQLKVGQLFIRISIMDPANKFKSKNNLEIPLGLPLEILLDRKIKAKRNSLLPNQPPIQLIGKAETISRDSAYKGPLALPYARIRKLWLKENMDLANDNLKSACAFSISLGLNALDKIIIEKIEVKVKKYDPNIEGFLIDEFLPTLTAPVYYIPINNKVGKYSTRYFLDGDKIEDSSIKHLVYESNQKTAIIRLRIEGAKPGIYTFDSYLEYIYQNKKYKLDLATNETWLFGN